MIHIKHAWFGVILCNLQVLLPPDEHLSEQYKPLKYVAKQWII